jgi:hypothetical protein
MNDDSLRRLLRNSLLGRKAPQGLWERLSARLSGAPRRPLALTLLAAAAIFAAAGLKLALRPADELPAPSPVVAAAPLPAWIAAAVEQHRGLSDIFTKTPPMAPCELTEKVLEQSRFFVDLPSLREAGYEPREVHRCLESGFAHVIYANTWSKLSCFLFEEAQAPLKDEGRPVPDGSGRLFVSGEASMVAVKDGPHVKLWIADLRPPQLASIALNAERTPASRNTTILANVKGSAPQAVEAVLRGILGVEDVRFAPGKVVVEYDERQVSKEAIGALATMKGVAEWGADGR